MAVVEIRKKKDGKDILVRKKIMICGKEFKPKFTMQIWRKMEDELCLLDDLYTMMHSKGRFDEDQIPKLAEMMTEGEISAREIADGCDPATMKAMLDEIQNVIAAAMTMKEKKYDDDSVHDETLEEIEKKDSRAG